MNICDVVSVGRTFLPVMTSGPSFALFVCEVTGDGVENMIVEAVQSPLMETLEVSHAVRYIEQFPKPLICVLGEGIA